MLPALRHSLAALALAGALLAPGPAAAAPGGSAGAPGGAPALPPIRVAVDGGILDLDVAPVVEQGRALVPARAVFTALGARVGWEDGSRTVTIGLGRLEIRLPVDAPRATVAGIPVPLDPPARIVAGRTLVPLRFLAEALGARVAWDPETRTAAIAARGEVGVARGGATLPDLPGGPLMAALARRQVGAPYAWGGDSPAGFDCSGLVRYVAAAAGLDLPRTSYEQFGQGVPVRQAGLAPGDLVFFSTYAPGPSHVGIYIGNRQFVHARDEDAGVTITSLDQAWWDARYVGARHLEK